MANNPLRQFLRRLCCDSSWNYAVFWKLQLNDRMLLTWEDGHYRGLRPRESMEASINECNVVEYPIGVAVAEMSGLHYALGEGLIGEVACTGNHLWMFSDNILPGELNSKLAPGCPVEWLFQFATGIKTILLVPVVPHGVLQLGSLEWVAEDLMLVDYIKDKFNAQQTFEESFLPLIANKGFLAQSSSLTSILIENLDKSFGIASHEIKSEYPDADDSVKPTYQRLSSANQMMSSCMVQNMCTVLGKDILKNLSSVGQNGNNSQHMCLFEEPKPVNQLLGDHVPEVSESKISGFSCLEEELHAFSNNDYSLGDSMDCGLTARNFCCNSDIIIESDTNKNANWPVRNDGHSFYSFPRYCELHKALGPTFVCNTDEYLQDSLMSGQDACSNSCLVSDGNFVKGIEPLAWETDQSFVSLDDPVHLSDPVITCEGGNLDDNSSKRSNNAKSITTSLGQFTASSITQCQSERTAFIGEDMAPWNREKSSVFVSQGGTLNTSSHPLASSFETMMSTLVEEEQKKGHGCLHTRKGSKLTFNKRRVNLGDNRRPRPRDRQLIQDRLKELRELVPCGAKCSIDSLLDRTIKHMLFLRSVVDQADKLRQCIHLEATSEKNMKCCEGRGGQQNGTSWAFEVGTEHQVWPIVVKDLECPGHMLIEMLCDDHLLFLEIAEVIQHSDLNILKGALESHSGNMWARFIVEAARGFHRLDIFWPLLRLLQQN